MEVVSLQHPPHVEPSSQNAQYFKAEQGSVFLRRDDGKNGEAGAAIRLLLRVHLKSSAESEDAPYDLIVPSIVDDDDVDDVVVAVLSPSPYYLDKPDLINEPVCNVSFNRVAWKNLRGNHDAIIAGNVYKHAIGMHAPASGWCTAEFRIPDGANWFHAIFGMAEEYQMLYGNAAGQVSFFVDGQWHDEWIGALLVYSNLTQSVPTYHLKIKKPIPKKATKIRLQTKSLNPSSFRPRHWACHTAWGDARFE